MSPSELMAERKYYLMQAANIVGYCEKYPQELERRLPEIQKLLTKALDP